MEHLDLFGERPAAADVQTPARAGAAAAPPPPRLRRPDRARVRMRPCSLDELIAADHDVRTLWAVVLRLDLAAFHAPLKARGGRPGRAATDPRLLVALWLWAATRG